LVCRGSFSDEISRQASLPNCAFILSTLWGRKSTKDDNVNRESIPTQGQ
jgi:hypothetical protein